MNCGKNKPLIYIFVVLVLLEALVPVRVSSEESVGLENSYESLGDAEKKDALRHPCFMSRCTRRRRRGQSRRRNDKKRSQIKVSLMF